ncbi:NUDIX domain containing protein [Nitzschia inconspicua]|uniref:NUDIX domain containing protein n=1 Tax=Nitzschia inconspicua TaxID=303405 RepID=A0A9K3LX59_9STRA|nr:NUDIX domain containing protein [Nitzschia inconspicua]
MAIKRVTTAFLVKGGRAGVAKHATSAQCSLHERDGLRIAIFHRCSTMPTFPNRYAACSGSIEAGEAPWETARRELHEETNFLVEYQAPTSPSIEGGLFVDVDFVSPRSGEVNVIRVYPFVIHVVNDFELALKGTEHDGFRWMSLDELEELDHQSRTVPSLALAFHHATAGRFDKRVCKEERQWASDKQNGASIMSKNALKLIMKSNTTDPARLSMLRPSMVTIVNCMQAVQKLLGSSHHSQQSTSHLHRKDAANQVLRTLDQEFNRSIVYAVDAILQLYRDNDQSPLVVGTFSRSSTLVAVLNQLLDDHSHVLQIPILCSRSIPGGEGEFMALDLNKRGEGASVRAVCIDDDELKKKLSSLDVLLIGADCILGDKSAVVNKLG